MPEKIIIVEDTKSIRNFLKEILTREHYDVLTASSGEEALKIFKDYMPDLMLLDVVMPGINGYEVCRKIREDETSKFIKIIMISSRAGLNRRLEGYDAGIDDYISKPFDEKELLAKIRVFMRLKAAEEQLRELNETLNKQVQTRTRQLLDAEKMAAIGRHAAGIIHNLNNPLCAIMATAQILALKYPNDNNVMLQRKAASQMARIIKTILATGSKESQQETIRLDMNEILHAQIELMASNLFFKNQVHTQLNLQPLPLYSGVYSHFSQSFSNLIKNAVDAMHDVREKKLTISSTAENNEIIIRIEDTGQGISERNIDKIFNPFFTTKPLMAENERPSGTGLGLASCKEMIESYGGSITADSIPGEGTCITVRLPLQNFQKTD